MFQIKIIIPVAMETSQRSGELFVLFVTKLKIPLKMTSVTYPSDLKNLSYKRA